MIDEQKFFALVAQETENLPEELTRETSIEDIGLDSLEFLELLLTLGENYSTIPDREIPKIQTLGDILEVLETQNA